MMENILEDYRQNRNNPKALIILAMYRIATIGRTNKFLFVMWIPYLIIYRVLIEWILGVEIPYKTIIGKGVSLHHGQSLVINDGTIIGDFCNLRHSTTIGNKRLADGSFSKSPVIGSNVDIGANVCIIGPITIGNKVKIGAGAVVTKNIPDEAIVVGNPARIL